MKPTPNIVTIVGTRPQFIKLDKKIPQIIVHSGQHYDYEMSEIFFKGMKLPKPDYNLGAKNFGRMFDQITKLLNKLQPKLVIVYGDCTTTLAGALAASYLEIPVAHIEAGVRSFAAMPEEINRVLTDRLATYRFCPNIDAKQNLLNEGIRENVYVVGDVMFDSMNPFCPLKKTKGGYVLLTVHRAANTTKDALTDILTAMSETKLPVIFPVHPRTKKAIRKFNIKVGKNIKLVKPVGYKEMLTLTANAKHVVTDSGGLQREAYWLQRPITLLRTETEWPEIVETGWATLCGTDKTKILESIQGNNRYFKEQPVFDYGAKERIRTLLDKYL